MAPENVDSARTGGDTTCGLMIENSSPVLRWAGGRQEFFAAVVGRRRRFEQNVARGAFNDAKTVLAK